MKETNSRSLGSRNRQKGHHAERFYADVFRELGYEHCITARLGGRIFDNAGSVITHSKLEEKDLHSLVSADEIIISGGSFVPSIIFHKGTVRT